MRASAALVVAVALGGLLWASAAAWRGGAAAFAREKAAPALAWWLAASADHAEADGVSPMPVDIRRALTGFVPDDVLDRVRYRIGGGRVTSLHTFAFLHAQTRAVTLDDVIVFRDVENAAKPRYWVHEIVHLEQIRRWGLEGFARRYLHDADAVEAEAWDLTERYVAWALRRELQAAGSAFSRAQKG